MKTGDICKIMHPVRRSVRVLRAAACLLLCLLFTRLFFLPASAADAVIGHCLLISDTRLEVTGTAPSPGKLPGDKIYLIAADASASSISSAAKPMASAEKESGVVFRVKSSKENVRSMLDKKFFLAVFENGKYRAISSGAYITNPGLLAKYTYAFPKALTKKGLQVADQLVEDAMELGVQHSVVNIVLTDMISSSSEHNTRSSIPYKFRGKTYWYRKGVIGSYDSWLSPLRENDTVVSAVLLLGYRTDLTRLISPGCRKNGYDWYNWNMQEAGPRQELEAAISFLAHRYSARNGSNGRIVNWIVGNEVNDYIYGNYAGHMPLKKYASYYADTVRMVYMAAASCYSNARVYISLDHLWNYRTNYSFTSREMLDAFAAAIRAGGYIPWNLAYHPYSSPLTEPKFWKNKNKQVQAALTSPVINMGNISVLSTYIRETYGKNTRIILSEQGYTSRQSGKNTSKAQSAAIAYSYYLTEADDQIDSFIMNRHIDHKTEVDQGLNLGIWNTSSIEWASSKKSAWKVYKYIDTNHSPEVADKLLRTIGAKRWEQLVSNYSEKLYTRRTVTIGKLVRTGAYKGKKIKGAWKAYGAVSSGQKIKGGFTVKHNASRNKNSMWGFTQSFRKLSFKKYSRFAMTVRISGETSGTAKIRVRLFGEPSEVFECSASVPCGRDIPLTVSLKNWTARGRVKRIQITAVLKKGSWSRGAEFKLTKAVRMAG